MCHIADTVEDGVAHDTRVAVILLTETYTACGWAMWVTNCGWANRVSSMSRGGLTVQGPGKSRHRRR